MEIWQILEQAGLWVKPLAWEEVSSRCKDAQGVGRLYRVLTMPDGSAKLTSGSFDRVGETFSSPEAAYEAARIDNDARVIGLLVKKEGVV